RNFPIMNDISKMQIVRLSGKNPVFNRSNFEEIVRSRCAENDECYREEFKYFSVIYKQKTNQYTDGLEHFETKIDSAGSDEILEILSHMVEVIYTSKIEMGNDSRSMAFYESLTRRLFVMEELKNMGIFKRRTHIDGDLEQFKNLIIEKFENTPWLNEK
ncbi:hypothetical protein PMAYCL1PPCAC_33163, partial [Pristionchus mayeri]